MFRLKAENLFNSGKLFRVRIESDQIVQIESEISSSGIAYKSLDRF